MTTNLRQQLSDGDVEQRIRSMFAVVVPLLEHGDARASTRQAVEPRARRLPLAIACGAMATVGVAGGLAIIARDGGESDRQTAPQPNTANGPTAASTGGADSTAPAPSTPATTAVSRSDRADQVQWFLPTVLPDGYELTDIYAELRVDGAPNPDYGGGVEVVGGPRPSVTRQTWIRRADDGSTNEDTISIETQSAGGAVSTASTPADSAGSSTAQGDGSEIPGTDVPQLDTSLIAPANTTVHGVDAVIVGPPMRESPGWTINWVESGRDVTIQTTGGVSEAEAMAIAEGSTVTADGASVDPAAVPAGFELVAPASSDPAQFDRVEAVTMVVSDGHQSVRVRIDTPATATLDELSIDETERRTIGGVDYSLFENDDTLYSRVIWLDDGRQFVADGRASLDDVLAVATGLRTATLDEAVAAADAVTAATRALPTVATATLADGVEVSVHGPVDDVGVVGICVDTPQPRCVRPLDPAWETGVPGMQIYSVFHIDGERRTIAWNGTEPELSDIDAVMPALVAASTGVGWFVDQPTPAGAALRGISFRADDGSLWGVSPIDVIRP